MSVVYNYPEGLHTFDYYMIRYLPFHLSFQIKLGLTVRLILRMVLVRGFASISNSSLGKNFA